MVEQYFIKDQVSFNEMKSYILEDSIEYNIDGNKIKTKEFEFELDTPFQKYINDFNKSKSKYSNDLIFGKDKTENVVAVEMFDQKVILFFKDGTIEERPFVYWVLTNRKVYKGSKNLKGDLHYKFITTFKSKESYDKFYYINKKRCDIYRVYDEVESAMIYYGITLFKGMTIDQLSLLSFDIEASGLARDNNSKVYLITNTSRINGKIERRQFREDHYKSMGKMLLDWCKYVREIDPDIILGHNIFGYDFDFMNHVAQNEGISLHLGRDGSEIMFNDYESNYRVDGSQSWKYKKCFIHGRIVFDTMFSSVKYDIGRNYPSWKLKKSLSTKV
jgi:DNA polymerase elongation subunit (family B)